MISKKAKYALKALKVLAQSYEKGPLLISHIAESEKIPKKFLEAILLELRNHGILQSQKGKGGGYYLRVPPSEVTFAKIIRIVDGPIAPALCVSLHFYGKCDDCADEEACQLRTVLCLANKVSVLVSAATGMSTTRDFRITARVLT